MAEQTIVLVNDHEDTVDMLVVWLKAAGFNVEGFTDANAALQRVTRGPEPCLLMVDSTTGDVHADEFIRRAKAAGVATPIVITTATPASRFDMNAAREQGVSHVLFMPFELDTVEALVKQYGRGGCA